MLCVQGLSLAAGEKQLINQLSCEILPGECWVIFGKNGIGKTTLLRTLAGLRQPDSGEVLLDGKPFAAWDTLLLAQQRAYLPQMRHDAFAYSVLQTVLAGRYPYQARHYWETDADLMAACLAMRQMDVLSLQDRDIRTLSGGERQRVALAAVLAQDTPVVLLDEPVNSLDLAHQAHFMQLVGQLCRERKKSVVMVVHDLNLAHGVATHALLMGKGGKWEAGTISEVMKADKLSQCLGYTITVLQHEGRFVYLPV
ncbi:MAG: ABC transporter ATP-binding protein [Betaproteobacteria bacterium]|nr:ABC transporter ATP-binding protein [Betaproteobacteria bacterium]